MGTHFEFRTDYHCDTGILQTVAPKLRRITANNPGPLTFCGTGTYVVGEGQVAVIDPGPDDPAHLDALLSALGDETISRILITHTHRDHSAGADALKERCGAPTVGMGTHTALQRPSALPEELDSAGDTDFVPDIVVRDNEIIGNEHWSLQCLHTPGHASNHAAFYEAAFDRLFVGDLVMGWSTPVLLPPDGHLGDYLSSLERLKSLEISTYWPTHGDRITDTNPVLTHLIEHRRQRSESVRQAVQQGHTSLHAIVNTTYPNLAPELYGAAVRSALASVVHLVETGVLEGDVSLGLDIELNSTY